MNITDGRKLSQAWMTAKVADDEAGGLFLDGPGLWEAAFSGHGLGKF
jgi:hypothetical protein